MSSRGPALAERRSLDGRSPPRHWPSVGGAFLRRDRLHQLPDHAGPPPTLVADHLFGDSTPSTASSASSRGDHLPGEMMDIYEGTPGSSWAGLSRCPHLHRLGDMNEHQVAIGETTFTADGAAGHHRHHRLRQPDAPGLQRGRTARQAIEVMGALVASTATTAPARPSPSPIPNEVWIMDIIGKGPGNTGAVWVARRIPTATSRRTPTVTDPSVPLNDPKNCL